MVGLHFKHTLHGEALLEQMRLDAREDVADAEADRPLPGKGAGAAGRPGPVCKLFYANRCVYNCSYCACRASHREGAGYHIPPRQLAELALRSAQGHRGGVFLSSAIHSSADETQEALLDS
jgi:2-iminoacetate synthase ThiH